MNTYSIESVAGVEMGDYEGGDEVEALVAMHTEQGIECRAEGGVVVFTDAEASEMAGGLDDWNVQAAWSAK